MSMLRYTALLLVTLVARPTEAEEPAFVLENDTCRWAVAADGTVQYFGTPDGQHNVCEPGQTCMQVLAGGQVHGASTVRLRINPASRDPEMFLAHDGRDKIELKPEDEIHVRRSDRPIRLVFLEKDYFFRNLKSRLRW